MNPVCAHICFTNLEQQQTKLCQGHNSRKLLVLARSIDSSWTNRTEPAAQQLICCAQKDQHDDLHHNKLKASLHDVTGSIYVHLLDSLRLKHLFTRLPIRGKVEYTVGTTQSPQDILFASNITCQV